MGEFLTVVGILVALIIGGIGILQSHKANHAADKALKAAENASQTGEEALKIAKRTEVRATETSNIHWEGHWADIGVYCLVNNGDDDAHHVKAVVTVDDEVVRAGSTLVSGGGGQLRMEFPQAAQQYRRDRAEYQRWERDSGRSGPMGLPGAIPIPPQVFHSLPERVDGLTGRGAPGSYEDTRNMASIGPDY